MRSDFALLPSLLALAGCPSGKPPVATVASIERRLAEDPCLSKLSTLRRTYQFAQRGWKIDPNRIDIAGQQAGHNGLPAGINIREVTRPTLDDTQFFGARAVYTVDTHRLDIWACGMNRGRSIRHLPIV